VQFSRQLISPEFTLVPTEQQTSSPRQSAFWSHEIRKFGPTLPGGGVQTLPLPQRSVSWPVLKSSIEQHTLSLLQV
jgi:hypothetical protein